MYAGVDKYGGAVVGEGQPADAAAAPTGLSLEDTLETAAAEETVVIDVPYSYYEDEEDESSLVTGTSQVLLAAQLNPSAGGLMWIEQESTQAAYKNVVAMSQMTSMLRDRDRNTCYERAIERAIARFSARHGRAPLVLDIGAGTGLLSLFAARHGAEHVYACEMFPPMAEIAQHVTAANYPDKITVFALRSTDIVVATEATGDASEAHLPRRADMLVSELFDSLLLGEAVIPIVRHALAHLLVPDAVVLPARATVFAHVVQNEQIYRMNSLAGQYVDDHEHVRLARNDRAWACTGAKPALPLHVRALEATNTALTQPTPVLSFDFTKPIAAPSVSGPALFKETVVRAVADGEVHGIVMWWHVHFGADVDDDESSEVYSTQPGVQNWQDHWVQVVFPLTERLSVHTTDALVLCAHHDDLRIWFDVEAAVEAEVATGASLSSSVSAASEHVEGTLAKKRRTAAVVSTEKEPCTCGLHLVSNAERIAMLADAERTQAFSGAIAKAVARLQAMRQQQQVADGVDDGGQALTTELVCLDASDGSLCALLAAAHGVAHVTSVESKDVSARIFEQILAGNAVSQETTAVLCCGCKGLLPAHLRGERRADLLVGEPFYYAMQNLPLWQALNFWLRRSALAADTLAPDALVVPAGARVCAQAVRFEHLHECFGTVGAVSGFDHAYFDQFQDACYARNFPFPVYMYPYTAASDVLTLGTWSFEDVAHSVSSDLVTALQPDEPAPNGVVVWVEYALDREGEHVVATGPRVVHSKQLVRFLPPAATPSLSLQSRFHFDALEGTVDVDFELL